jgi:hypothetical protein
MAVDASTPADTAGGLVPDAAAVSNNTKQKTETTKTEGNEDETLTQQNMNVPPDGLDALTQEETKTPKPPINLTPNRS